MASKGKRTERSLVSIREYVDSHPRSVTQRVIARRLGISESLLSNMLDGYRPSQATADKLKAYGIDVYAAVEARA
jgi:hypothetical protein